MMTTAEKIKVMQAYEDGKQIQKVTRGEEDWKDWDVSWEPTWNWDTFDYRVKPEEVKHKYKVGDYVLVLDGSNIPNYTGDWAMTEYVGKIYQIRALKEWEGLPCYYLSGGIPCLNFDERGLALVKIGE